MISTSNHPHSRIHVPNILSIRSDFTARNPNSRSNGYLLREA